MTRSLELARWITGLVALMATCFAGFGAESLDPPDGRLYARP